MVEFGSLSQRIERRSEIVSRSKHEALPTHALDLQDPRAAAEWHWRVGLPMATLVSVVFGFGLARVPPRGGRFARMLPAVLVFILYLLLLLLNQNAIARVDCRPCSACGSSTAPFGDRHPGSTAHVAAGEGLMLRIDRYIAKVLLQTILVVLLAFVGLTAIFALVEELRDGAAGYGFAIAAQYVAYTIPRRTYELVPYVVFLGTLVGLGSLASHSELTVLRASGMSVWRLFASAAMPALLVLTLSAALGEWGAPDAEEAGEAVKAHARQASERIKLRGGSWYREGGLFVNVDALDADGSLLGVRQYQLDDEHRLTAVRNARRARAEQDGWMLEDVVESNLADDAVSARRYAERRWRMQASPTLLSTRTLVQPRKLALSELAGQIDYMKREGLDSARHELAFWTKLLQPAATLSLTALALAFILGPLREVSMGSRLAVGVVAGLAFKYLQDLFGPMTMVYDLPAAVAVLLPILACAVGAVVAVRRLG
ncbi:MAG: LPS export ABC transporter permease LptG [Gammaproteobacteria bacterium]|nr:LPS export ABC transporter permease LptG [Gammaproteobacteria bacterium]